MISTESLPLAMFLVDGSLAFLLSELVMYFAETWFDNLLYMFLVCLSAELYR